MYGMGNYPPPRGPITLILEFAAAVAIGGWLIKLGIGFLTEIRWSIALILLLMVGGIIGYRIWKSKHDNWR